MGRVILADDHPLFRHALRIVIGRTQPDLTISEVETLAGAKTILDRESDVVLVTLDLKMSDCDDFAGLLSLRGSHPQIPIVVVSSTCDANTINYAMTFGAAGFIPKSSTGAEIGDALETILGGETWVPAGSYASLVPEAIKSVASLTPAQLQILMGLRRGLRNKEIAHEMGVTEKTVRAYTTTMFRKLGVSSRTQALIAVQSLTTGNYLSG